MNKPTALLLILAALAAAGTLRADEPTLGPDYTHSPAAAPRPNIILKDSPVNCTSATMSVGISEPMGGWRGWCRVFRRLISCCRNGFPPPWGGEFLASAQTVSQSAAAGLRCLASGTDQRL